MMARKKRKKTYYPIGRKEFLFNVVSLLLVIGVGVYFGARSYYYYGKQNIKMRQEEQTLNGTMLSLNSIVQDGNGLHQDTEGYYFKGKVSNNYVRFANRNFRIIEVLNDGSVRMVTDDIVAEFMWGEESSYQSSNLHLWLTKSDSSPSGVYYDTLPNPNKFLVQTSYTEDQLLDSKVSSSTIEYQDYVTALSIHDYVRAGGQDSYFNIGKYFWLLGLDKDNSNLYVEPDGSVFSAAFDEAYGVRAVITLKANLAITGGDGSAQNPFVIDQGEDTNYVNQFVRLGTDIYKVFGDKDGVLSLSLAGYLTISSEIYVSPYSNSNTYFDSSRRDHLAYFLNSTYLNSLSYASLLRDTVFYLGEVSSDTGLLYSNIYQNTGVYKIGLLNVFDYNVNSSLDNYFLINTTSTVGSMGYVYRANGLLEEAHVSEAKHVVLVVSIDRNLISGGTGSLKDPFLVPISFNT